MRERKEITMTEGRGRVSERGERGERGRGRGEGGGEDCFDSCKIVEATAVCRSIHRVPSNIRNRHEAHV